MPQLTSPEGSDSTQQAGVVAGAPEIKSTPPAPMPASLRFHELDALRAGAMLLGIVLHAFLFLIPDAWPIQHSDPPALVYWIGLNVIHGFRMPVFFLLSGFFTAMLWERRGLRQLALHRGKRIALPLALCCITVIPVNSWAFIGSEFSFGFWPFYWVYGFHHLWFLWILLWLGAAFLVLARLGVQFSHPVLWWLLIPLALAPQFFMHEPIVGPDTPGGLVPHPLVVGYYACFFFFGAFFYRRRFIMRRWWVLGLLPALLLVFPVAFVLLFPEEKVAWVLPVSTVFQVVYAWLMCFGLIGLFRLIASRERPWVRYASDSSYWLYLWHLPLIVFAQRIVLDWPISPHLKFVLICVTVTAVLLATYQLGVRYTPIGTMLNGKRERPRRKSVAVIE
ncbi:MAG: acyltransferase [Chloroflexi bacterium]|nr:acyltransferase [Chloroflexota bacterium]